MTQADKARQFAALHQKGTPLRLFNIWDAGSAAAVERAGAQAIATGSWSVAAAQGYADGEKLPLDTLLQIATRIVANTALPVSIDFEGGYPDAASGLADNIKRLITTGAIGLNFEDQIIGGTGLVSIEDQSKRIKTIRDTANDLNIPLFINARTDLFLQESDASKHPALVAPALERASAYRAAGASGFFIPGLKNISLISQICKGTELAVNAMQLDVSLPTSDLAHAGIARISRGPAPYFNAMDALAQQATEMFA